MSESWSWKPIVVIGLIVGGVWWWNAQSGSEPRNVVSQGADCSQVLSAALNQVRSGRTSGTINEKMDLLNGNCDAEYDAITGYLQARGSIEQFGREPCATWEQRVGAAAADLLRADGLCATGSVPTDADLPDYAIVWSSARNHIGEVRQVCGPLASIRGSDDDVFLNVGRDYPDSSRFTIVLWDVGGVERLPAGTEVCATGAISQYQGTAQIELRDVSAVKVRAH
ncbi:hypothetical protein [Microbacterium sp. nov. GSS16]|uniref:hypothetical protein n=1 Tax=Microbacterium sp. nov. GSS16 TaxID=3019890 RepID=UPI002305DA2C|nr:hypothetical protein [Microbacterium sp. nov. GSS16]WCD93280.1 hypothetical protein PGB26_03080 [Microbacterium sp. nov. GSS16]